MAKLFAPRKRALYIPGSTAKQLRGPDPRGLILTEPSSAPYPNDVDYDDLTVNKTWREYHDTSGGDVKYFCYELTQRCLDDTEPVTYYKAVRFIRLTRVPRYLKQSGAASAAGVFSQMRDVLVGLREKNVLFCHLIAKSPNLPLVFAYGVQGVADTIEAAQMLADEAYAALSVNLDGTYQQLEYQPLNAAEAEHLTSYQNQWNNLAIARGRPVPQGAALGSSAIFDGNRTDVENTNNQLESFIRGMSDKSFMLSLVTVPMKAADITLAWKNLSDTLSKVKSDVDGSRGMAAGIAIPLGMGTSMAHTTGDTHGLTNTDTSGVSDSHGTSSSDGYAHSNTDTISQGENVTHSDGVNRSDATSLSDTHTAGTSTSAGTADNTGHTDTTGTNAGTNTSQAAGHTDTAGRTDTAGTNTSTAHGQTTSQSYGVNSSQGVSQGTTAGSNWSATAGHATTAGQTLSSGWNEGDSSGTSTGYSTGTNIGNGLNQAGSTSEGSSVGGGVPFLSGGHNSSSGYSSGDNSSVGHSSGTSVSGSHGHNSGVSGSAANSVSSTNNYSNTSGGSLANSLTNTSTVGTSETATTGASLTQTAGTSASVAHSASAADSLTSTVGASQGTSASAASSTGHTASVGSGTNAAAAATTGTSATAGTSASTAQGTNTGTSTATGNTVNTTDGVNATKGVNTSQAVADGWSAAFSRQAGQTASLGVVPTLTATVTKQTRNESKRTVADMLEAQAARYVDGIEGGAFLYQMFLVCPDRETLIGAATLLKSAFWGSGGKKERLPSPFHTAIIDDEEEAARLLTHAACFSSYQKREPVASLVEPYMYSTYVTTGEASCFCHPPVAEAPGIQTQTDSMPVLAMPADREHKEIYLGHVVNGERGRVSDIRFGVSADELNHVLIQGVTGMGKTTTMLRLLEQLSTVTRDVTDPVDPANPNRERVTRTLPAGALVLDWMNSARNLAAVIPADRFQMFSVSNPDIGAFRFNPLEIPHLDMDPAEWLGAITDQLCVSFGLGDVGRSIISELLDTLYTADRLEDTVLRPAVIDDITGQILRPAITLAKVNRSELPDAAISYDSNGNAYANVYSYPKLSRLVGLPELAVLVAVKAEEAATVEAAKTQGVDMRNRINSVWRRIQYYAPGNHMAAMLAPDPSLTQRECLSVSDLIDPDKGLFTVIETDGLSYESRRIIVGSVMLAVYRYGMHVGNGCFNHNGDGPGTYLVLEEAHEILGSGGAEETTDSAKLRTGLYTSMFRRIRATGMRLVAMTQNCAQIPPAIVGQTSTLFAHHTTELADRNTLFGLLNWINAIGQHQREFRYLGEMPSGWAIVRMKAQTSYLESAPIQVVIDPVELPTITDEDLAILAHNRKQARRQ